MNKNTLQQPTEKEKKDTPRLQVDNICKSFGGLRANDHVSFDVLPGEVHCLLGENGAGKTTVMNIVYGLYHADNGRILIDGNPVHIRNPHEAIAHGIGMVHQHFMLVNNLTVAENVILGTQHLFSRELFLTNMKKVESDVVETGRKYGLKINPSVLISELSVGEQQRVEIVKALHRGIQLLILDEPTAVLTPQEIDDLFHTLKQLTASGLSVIFISHKLNEIMKIGDRVTVLRDGKVVGKRNVSETSTAELAKLMVGRDVKFSLDKAQIKPGNTVLDIQNLSQKNSHGRQVLSEISLSVSEGEILGIAGVDGNGQRELALTIVGVLKPDSGKIMINNQDITGQSPRSIIEAGVCHIPEDRQTMGLVMEFSVADNFILKDYNKKPFAEKGLLRPQKILDYASRLVKSFDVRTTSIKKPAGFLSGGNQQKVVLGRELDKNPKVLLAMQPTRGLDVGATEYVHNQIIKQRERGAAILLISTELDEVLALSDRIAVLYEGKIVGEMPSDNSNVQQIGLLMAGVEVGQPVVS